jgi:hypothetical protein
MMRMAASYQVSRQWKRAREDRAGHRVAKEKRPAAPAGRF